MSYRGAGKPLGSMNQNPAMMNKFGFDSSSAGRGAGAMGTGTFGKGKTGADYDGDLSEDEDDYGFDEDYGGDSNFGISGMEEEDEEDVKFDRKYQQAASGWNKPGMKAAGQPPPTQKKKYEYGGGREPKKNDYGGPIDTGKQMYKTAYGGAPVSSMNLTAKKSATSAYGFGDKKPGDIGSKNIDLSESEGDSDDPYNFDINLTKKPDPQAKGKFSQGFGQNMDSKATFGKKPSVDLGDESDDYEEDFEVDFSKKADLSKKPEPLKVPAEKQSVPDFSQSKKLSKNSSDSDSQPEKKVKGKAGSRKSSEAGAQKRNISQNSGGTNSNLNDKAVFPDENEQSKDEGEPEDEEYDPAKFAEYLKSQGMGEALVASNNFDEKAQSRSEESKRKGDSDEEDEYGEKSENYESEFEPDEPSKSLDLEGKNNSEENISSFLKKNEEEPSQITPDKGSKQGDTSSKIFDDKNLLNASKEKDMKENLKEKSGAGSNDDNSNLNRPFSKSNSINITQGGLHSDSANILHEQLKSVQESSSAGNMKKQGAASPSKEQAGKPILPPSMISMGKEKGKENDWSNIVSAIGSNLNQSHSQNVGIMKDQLDLQNEKIDKLEGDLKEERNASAYVKRLVDQLNIELKKKETELDSQVMRVKVIEQENQSLRMAAEEAKAELAKREGLFQTMDLRELETKREIERLKAENERKTTLMKDRQEFLEQHTINVVIEDERLKHEAIRKELQDEVDFLKKQLEATVRDFRSYKEDASRLSLTAAEKSKYENEIRVLKEKLIDKPLLDVIRRQKDVSLMSKDCLSQEYVMQEVVCRGYEREIERLHNEIKKLRELLHDGGGLLVHQKGRPLGSSINQLEEYKKLEKTHGELQTSVFRMREQLEGEIDRLKQTNKELREKLKSNEESVPIEIHKAKEKEALELRVQIERLQAEKLGNEAEYAGQLRKQREKIGELEVFIEAARKFAIGAQKTQSNGDGSSKEKRLLQEQKENIRARELLKELEIKLGSEEEKNQAFGYFKTAFGKVLYRVVKEEEKEARRVLSLYDNLRSYLSGEVKTEEKLSTIKSLLRSFVSMTRPLVANNELIDDVLAGALVGSTNGVEEYISQMKPTNFKAIANRITTACDAIFIAVGLGLVEKACSRNTSTKGARTTSHKTKYNNFMSTEKPELKKVMTKEKIERMGLLEKRISEKEMSIAQNLNSLSSYESSVIRPHVEGFKELLQLKNSQIGEFSSELSNIMGELKKMSRPKTASASTKKASQAF